MIFTRKLDVLGHDPDVDPQGDKFLLFVTPGATLPGCFKVATAIAEVTPIPRNDILASQVADLRQQREDLIASTKAKLDKIDARLQELQALPNGVAA